MKPTRLLEVGTVLAFTHTVKSDPRSQVRSTDESLAIPMFDRVLSGRCETIRGTVVTSGRGARLRRRSQP